LRIDHKEHYKVNSSWADRLLDMSRTAVNLTGDLVACVLLGSKNNMKSKSTQV
jgi:Na+/H+-dicarboxylate symporter